MPITLNTMCATTEATIVPRRAYHHASAIPLKNITPISSSASSQGPGT